MGSKYVQTAKAKLVTTMGRKLSVTLVALIAMISFKIEAASNPVPLVSLITMPQAFDGKVVSTIGWILISPSGTHPMAKLYLTKDDLEYDNYSYEVRIDMNRPRLESLMKLNNKMIVVEGTFKKSAYSTLAPSSAIVEISDIREKEKEPLKMPEVPRKSK
jgi:hypothetical protein